MNCGHKNKTVKLRIDEQDEAIFRQAAKHIFGKDNLSHFLREAGLALIEKYHGKIESVWESIIVEPDAMPLYSEKSGDVKLSFRKPYQKKKWRNHAKY